MATLPNAKVACRLALANYIRTNMTASWPNLVVSENWPQPQKAFPPQAITVLAPSTGQVIQYHAPVIWQVSLISGGPSCTVTYSYGILSIPFQLDAWAQYESTRDDMAATLTPLLNRNPDVSLGNLGIFSELTVTPGLVIPIPTYYNITAEFVFAPAPSPLENSDSAMTGEWRATWEGNATIYVMNQETFPSMQQIYIQDTIGPNPNTAPTETIQIAP